MSSYWLRPSKRACFLARIRVIASSTVTASAYSASGVTVSPLRAAAANSGAALRHINRTTTISVFTAASSARVATNTAHRD
uniref:Uncharacterized protein n=1 Tax=Oryza glumipatula TaxID=40148 RepID=A0A0D9ZWQ3_9ORYZ